MAVILSLLLAHLLGDFVLQRQRVVDGKRAGRPGAFVEHGAVHLVCLAGVWQAFGPLPLTDPRVWAAFAAILITHLLSDWIKSRVARRPLRAFVADQCFHLLVLAAAAWFLAGDPALREAASGWWTAHAPLIALVGAAYLSAVFACGWFNMVLLGPLNPGDSPGLARAGMYIGWLERFLMLSAVIVHAWAALGLVLAAKSIFRFEAIRRDRRHAEYFVIGTLVSVSEVVLIGALLLALMPLVMPHG